MVALQNNAKVNKQGVIRCGHCNSASIQTRVSTENETTKITLSCRKCKTVAAEVL